MADRPADVRLLTVKQPWASLIMAGQKDVENRTWPFPYPLPTTIGIHAGKGYDRHAGSWTIGQHEATREALPRGVILGLVDVVADHDDCGGECSPFAVHGHRHWRVVRPRALAWPIECRGSLWLFKPAPPAVALRLKRQIDRMNLTKTLALG